MEGLLGGLSSGLGSLFGSMGGLSDLLGGDMFKNILGAVMGFKNMGMQKDALNFQKGLAQDAQRKSNILFDQDQQDREALNDLNFG